MAGIPSYLAGQDIEDIAEYQRRGAELTCPRSDLEKAKEALKPFVANVTDMNGWKDSWSVFQGITVGHLRTAARILSELENSK